MNVIRKTSHSHSLIILAMASLLLVFSSCARKMSFGNSPVVPAAEGSVKIKTDKNKNSTIELKMTNLAPADKLTPPKQTYVVWMVTDNNGTKNIGQLNSSSGLFSSTLKASLKTVTSFNPVSFFVTAEDNASIQYPGSQIVISTLGN